MGFQDNAFFDLLSSRVGAVLNKGGKKSSGVSVASLFKALGGNVGREQAVKVAQAPMFRLTTLSASAFDFPFDGKTKFSNVFRQPKRRGYKVNVWEFPIWGPEKVLKELF
jgi:hypothetical protein